MESASSPVYSLGLLEIVDLRRDCGQCGKGFSTSTALQEHRYESTYHGFCRACREDFGTWSNLEWHRLKEHGYCRGCDQDMGSLLQLRAHYQARHARRSESLEARTAFVQGIHSDRVADRTHKYCAPCGSNLSDPAKEHDVWEHGLCTVCYHRAGNYAQLQEHVRRCHPRYCIICDRFFQSSNNLREHLASSRHRPAQYPCPFERTERKFISLAALAAHFDANACAIVTRGRLNETIHLWDSKHERLVVDGRFSPDYNTWPQLALELQLAVAQAARISVCEQCRVDFGNYEALKAHIQSPAHDLPIYRCRGCEERFVTFSGVCKRIASGKL